jgi:ATP-binding cassette subfamily B protein
VGKAPDSNKRTSRTDGKNTAHKDGKDSKTSKDGEDGKPEPSESEVLLFGGPLRYDMGWSQHADAFLELNFRAMVRRLPSLLASSFRLAWQADRRAARTVLATEIGRGLPQAVSLLAVNAVLARLMAGGPIENRLREAALPLLTVAAVMLLAALLRAASAYATGRLEPQ